jgi:hypothetical protein
MAAAPATRSIMPATRCIRNRIRIDKAVSVSIKLQIRGALTNLVMRGTLSVDFVGLSQALPISRFDLDIAPTCFPFHWLIKRIKQAPNLKEETSCELDLA